jgi:hypothetical protein
MAPNLKVARVCSVHPLAVLFERRPRSVEHLCRPPEIARDKRDLGFSHDAPRACHGFFRTEGPSRSPQKLLRPFEIAELRHCDASQRERGRIVAQCNSPQCAERITCAKGPCCGCDQRIHQNPAILVTPRSF